jgi:hypothetical protein
MRPTHLTILFAVLAAALLPQAAHAQYSTCTEFSCDSYGAYDPYSNEISGYSRTVDYWWGWYLYTYSSIDAPDGEGETTVATNEGAGYWEAEADVYYAPGQNGQFSIDGDHQYELEDNEMDDGQSFYPVDVEPPPPLFTPCPGPWYPGTNSVSVSGSGFTGQAVSIYGSGVDSNTLSVMSDTLIQGSVQVNSGIVSQTFVSLVVGDGACAVALEPTDPTPNITGVTPPPPWPAGQQVTFTVNGTGFGTDPNLTITDANGTQVYSGSCWGSQCDTSIGGTVTIYTSGNATATVASNGYSGMGFLGNPGEPASGNYGVPVEGTGCGDQRDAIIAEYPQYGASSTPGCSDFTNDGHSDHFSFSELKSPDAGWAILTVDLLAGLEVTRMAEGGSPITISRAYSTPAHNFEVSQGATPDSQHIYGDAADMATGGVQTTWDTLREAARSSLACVEPENISKISHVHADWRGWCPTGW